MIRFDDITGKLQQRLTQPLPGEVAHNRLRAIPVGTFRPWFDHQTAPRPSSVLVLLYPCRDSVCFPLILRPDYAGAHSGQVSLPGGKREPGESEIETALRECEEEIGVDRSTIRVIGKLSDFFVIPSNFIVTPVVGVVPTQPVFRADPVEVAKILEGDLIQLLHREAIREKQILAAGQYPMLAPHFEIGGELVWGATAMMLNELRTVLLEIA